MNKKTKIFSVSFALAIGGGLLLLIPSFVNASNFLFRSTANDLMRGVVLNDSNKLALTNEFGDKTGELKTAENNPVNVSLTSAKTLEGGFATLSATGVIENTSMVTGIESVEATFVGNLSVAFSSDRYEFTTPVALTTGVKYELPKTFDYFKFTTDVETQVSSITVQHSCTTRFVLDEGQVLEAEDAFTDVERHVKEETNSHLSGHGYLMNINDAGEGACFRYFAYAAGNRDVTITYFTGSPDAQNFLFLNGNKYTVTYTEDTGWFNGSNDSAVVTISDVAFVAGWNELTLMKDGPSPDYGKWVQIDCIRVSGSNRRVDPTEFDKTSYSYTLEAELAHFHYDGGTVPISWKDDPFSCGFGLGEFNKDGDGAKFTVNFAEAGTYAIRPVLGGNKDLKVTLDDEVLSEGVELDGYTGWNSPTAIPNTVLRVELTAGVHEIDFFRGSNWFTFDKLIIEKVA